MTSPTFGKFELALQCVGTFGIFGTHIYLYSMGLNLLSLIKSLGLPSSKWAECGLSTAIILDLGQASRYFLQSIVILLIDNSDFECSENVQMLFIIATEYMNFVNPMIYQILFVGTVIMMSKISSVNAQQAAQEMEGAEPTLSID